MRHKRILIAITFILLGLILHGQSTTNNFKNENGSLIWQKIYERDSTKNIIDIFVSSGIFENFIIKDGQIMGDLKPFDTDYKGAGFSEMNTPIYVARSRIKGFLTIEIKDTRFRATIKDIILIQKYDDGLSKQGEETSLSSFALKGSTDFKSAFLKTPAIVFNFSLEKRISVIKSEDKW
jgi:hypothetical protein